MKNSNEVYENPKKALNKLTIPILITSLIGNINGMIDIVFVSLLGIGELSVLSLLTPFYILIFVLGISIGIGTNVLMSRYIGKEDTDSANKIFNNSIFIALIIGIILTVMISLFNKQIFALFGVPNNLYNFAMEYSVIFYGSIIFLMQGILSAIFNVELKPKLNIYYSILTAIINIILNYLLMFILGLGIFGIALSTLLSSLIIVIGMSILLYVKDDWIVNYHISFQFFDLKRIHNLFSITIPSFLESNISTVFNIILNHLLLIVGGLIAVGIYTGAWHLIFIGCIAVGAYKSSLNTIVSMFYGQGDLKTIKELYFYSIRNTSIAGFIL